MRYLNANDYGVIGNRFSSALVSRLGSIDWCSLPYLDSPSHFGAYIDQNQGGRFQIIPQGEYRSSQRYLPGTQILETLFETPTGSGILRDWMPIDDAEPPIFSIHRKVEMKEGKINWMVTCLPRFRYGVDSAQAEKHPLGILFRGNYPEDLALLQSQVALEVSQNGTSGIARFALEDGQSTHFIWSWGRRSNLSDPLSSITSNLDSTMNYWKKINHKCPSSGCIFGGPWHDAVSRSGLILKLLATPYAGSITEAIVVTLRGPTPNSRIWCPRYSSIREGASIIRALVTLGYEKEAQAHFAWITEILERDGAEGLQPMYTLDGGKILPERDLPYLNAHEGSRQFQLDIYGHVMLAAAEYFQFYGHLPKELWEKLSDIADYVSQAWRRPDYGIWGSATKPEHFVASKVFCWVALDKACWLAQEMKKNASPRWLGERTILHRTICEQGFNSERNSFIRSFGDSEIDTSILWLPILNFLPADDYRIQGSMDTVQLELSNGVLLRRSKTSGDFRSDEAVDLWSTFLFISCLAISGRVDEASDRLAEVCTYASPLGLFGDQLDAVRDSLPRDFPSATVHLSLINAALHLGLAKGRKGFLPKVEKPISLKRAI